MIYDFIQSDYRWANHPYAGENMAVAGCGPTSVADVTGILPPDVADYITSIGGASDGQGTYWGAIIPACERYGFTGVQMNGNDLYGQYDSNVERNWLAQMKTGKFYGILLMGRSYFCSSGHFIAIKQVNDNNDAYALDVAYSPRSGWHPWSTYQGMVKVFYLVENKDADPGDYYTFTTKQIKYGDCGKDVFRLQIILRARGYYTGKPNSKFSKALENALKKWQAKAGLVVDGICGPMSWATLLGLGQVNGAWRVDECQIGDTNNKSVLLLQEMLKGLPAKYYTGQLDWSFGPATQNALINFQKTANANGANLRTDGYWDKTTIAYMIG